MEYMNNLIMNIGYDPKTNTIRDKISKTDMIVYGENALPVLQWINPWHNNNVYVLESKINNAKNFLYPNSTITNLFTNLKDFTLGFWVRMGNQYSEKQYVFGFGTRNYGSRDIGILITTTEILLSKPGSYNPYNFNDDGGSGCLSDFYGDRDSIYNTNYIDINKWFYVEIYYKLYGTSYQLTHSINGRYMYNVYNSENSVDYNNPNYHYTPVWYPESYFRWGDFTLLGSSYDIENSYTFRDASIYDFAVYDKIIHTSNFTPPYREVYEDYRRIWSISDTMYGNIISEE